MPGYDLLFKTEEEILAGKFMFVSYSHKDKDIVRSDVAALIDNGARLWIDQRDENHENIKIGDNWVTKVEETIKHPNCQGVIFYVSPYFLASRAIYEHEYCLAFERFGKKMLYSIRIVDDPGMTSMQYYYGEAINLCNDNNSVYYSNTYLDQMSKQRELFIDDNISAIRYTDKPLEHQEGFTKILNILREKGVIDDVAKVDRDTAVAEEELEEVLESRNGLGVTLGVYKTAEYDGGLSDVGNDGRFKVGNNEYMHCDGKNYFVKELFWKLLYHKKDTDTAVLISSDIVDRCSAVEMREFLKKFKELAFNEKEKALVIGDVRLFNSNDADMLTGERTKVLELDSQSGDCTWWTDDRGLIEDSWQIVYKNSKQYGRGFARNLKKGVRPVIEVDFKMFKEYKNPKKDSENNNEGITEG